MDFETKDLSLKLSWVKKAYSTNNVWKYIANAMLPLTIPELFECNLAMKDVQKIGIKDNWTISSVVKAWANIHHDKPQTETEILNQNLWYNSWIRQLGKPYVNKTFRNRGILRLRDIVDVNNKFYTFEELRDLFGNLGFFTEYVALTKNIPINWKEVLGHVPGNTHNQDREGTDSKLFEIIENNAKISAKMYWEMINKREKIWDHGKICWETELGKKWIKQEWGKIRMYTFKNTQSVKLRYFQYRILSKKLTTNVTRNKWDNTINMKCTFCHIKKETVLHVLWECNIVQKIWKSVEKWLNYICNIQHEFKMEEIITNISKGPEKIIYRNPYINYKTVYICSKMLK